ESLDRSPLLLVRRHLRTRNESMGRLSLLQMARRHYATLRLLSATQRTAPQAVRCARPFFFTLPATFGVATAEGVPADQLVGQRLSLRGARQSDQTTQLHRSHLRSHAHNF